MWFFVFHLLLPMKSVNSVKWSDVCVLLAPVYVIKPARLRVSQHPHPSADSAAPGAPGRSVTSLRSGRDIQTGKARVCSLWEESKETHKYTQHTHREHAQHREIFSGTCVTDGAFSEGCSVNRLSRSGFCCVTSEEGGGGELKLHVESLWAVGMVMTEE